MRFYKMHGLGNDFIMVAAPWDDPFFRDHAKELCDRHTGIGADGVVLYGPGESTDVYMRIYNSDGSEAPMCGNATRCLGKLVYETGLVHKSRFSMNTVGGVKVLEVTVDESDHVTSVRVNMGVPVLETEKIPAIAPVPRFIDLPYTAAGMDVRGTLVNTGTSHSVIFMDEVEGLDLKAIGPDFENHPMFPNRVNTEFVSLLPDGTLRMRVYERGAGETMACGTGACAVMVAAKILGHAGDTAVIHLDGGDLMMSWQGEGEPVYMEGPAVISFIGELER